MSFPDDNQINRSFSLGQLLAQGPLPLPDALRSAMMLAEAIRQIHDSGRTCGALLPSSIAITASGLELIDEPGQPAAITPYTAPEVPARPHPGLAAISSPLAPSFNMK
jgi:hypothetical protein